MESHSDYISKIRENLPEIQNEFGVSGLCVFGSHARGQATDRSDIDILVDMPPKMFVMYELKEYLENLLHVSVDLIRRHSHLSSSFLKQVARDGVTLL